jgi:hypothetical protein
LLLCGRGWGGSVPEDLDPAPLLLFRITLSMMLTVTMIVGHLSLLKLQLQTMQVALQAHALQVKLLCQLLPQLLPFCLRLDLSLLQRLIMTVSDCIPAPWLGLLLTSALAVNSSRHSQEEPA